MENRFEQSQAYNADNEENIIVMPADDYCFYVGSDTHICNSTKILQNVLTIARNDKKNAFMLLLGDIVGKKGAYHLLPDAVAFNAITQTYNTRLFPTVGNHDLWFGEWEQYVKVFGTATYSVIVQTPNVKDLYILLDSSSAMLGKKQLKWLKNLLQTRREYRHCIIGTHINMFREDNSQRESGNFALEETMALISLFSDNQVDMFISGHDHHYGFDIFKNVLYLTCNSLKEDETPAYLKIDINNKFQFQLFKLNR